MKVVKALLIAVGALVAVALVVPAFLPKEHHVERSIEIAKPIGTVFNVVKDYDYYKKWNPWSKIEPTAKSELSGNPPGEIGSRWSWEGKEVGKGSLTLVEFVPNESIKGKLEFLAPFEAQSWDLWKFQEMEGGMTQVTWINEGESSYLMRYMVPSMDGMLGPQFEQGLADLKALIESLPDPPAPDTVTERGVTEG